MTEPDTADECLAALFELFDSGRASAFHGAYDDWGRIVSSLDLHFEMNGPSDPEAQKKEETRLLESFVKDAWIHLTPGARRHIELARLDWKTLRTTGTLYVGRHHGLPTRCVDWTSHWLTGLFFACRREFDKPGIVWWMSYDNFTQALKLQWPTAYRKRGHVTRDIERDFIEGDDKDVFVRLHYPEFMERAHSQEAWITLSLKYGVNHDEALAQMGVCECGRLVVKPAVKRTLLDKLDRLGVNGRSLVLGDACVELVAADVARRAHGTKCCPTE
ncbi:MAG: FRG domain-containing protein [Phycisphaerae bacterium]